MPGATVVATDETTNVSREAQSDAEGQFEIPNLRPGTYTVSASLSGFKKSQTHRPGVARGSGRPRRSAPRSRRPRGRGHRHAPKGRTTSRSRARRSSAGSTSSSFATFRETAATCRTSSRSIPNIVGGFDGIQFLGGRTYGASYIQDGQPSSAGIFGELSNAAPGLDAISEVQVLSNSYSAEYGGLAGVIVSTKRGANRFHGIVVHDFNSNELNALTYGQTLTGVKRDDPNADTHDYRYGASLGGPVIANRTFFFGNYEGSRQKQLGGGAQAVVPTAAMRTGDFSGANFVVRDPRDRRAVPGQPHSGGAHRSGGAPHHRLLLSAAEPGRRSRMAASARYRQILAAQSQPRTR